MEEQKRDIGEAFKDPNNIKNLAKLGVFGMLKALKYTVIEKKNVKKKDVIIDSINVMILGFKVVDGIYNDEKITTALAEKYHVNLNDVSASLSLVNSLDAFKNSIESLSSMVIGLNKEDSAILKTETLLDMLQVFSSYGVSTMYDILTDGNKQKGSAATVLVGIFFTMLKIIEKMVTTDKISNYIKAIYQTSDMLRYMSHTPMGKSILDNLGPVGEAIANNGKPNMNNVAGHTNFGYGASNFSGGGSGNMYNPGGAMHPSQMVGGGGTYAYNPNNFSR